MVMFQCFLLLALSAQSQCFLVDDATSFKHPAASHRKVYEFNWELTWESSMLYTDSDDVTWVSNYKFIMKMKEKLKFHFQLTVVTLRMCNH